MTPDEALNALVETLEELQRILPPDKDTWDASPVVRLAVERLWITAGNAAEEFRRATSVDAGVEPWAELSGYRNRFAHALPGDVASDRVWADTTSDLQAILMQLRGMASDSGA